MCKQAPGPYPESPNPYVCRQSQQSPRTVAAGANQWRRFFNNRLSLCPTTPPLEVG